MKRTRACSQPGGHEPGHHPEHPTADGGLPTSEPGLSTSTHNLVSP